MAEYNQSNTDFQFLLVEFGKEAARRGHYIGFKSQGLYSVISTESDREADPMITEDEYNDLDKAFGLFKLENKTMMLCTYQFYTTDKPNKAMISRSRGLTKHTVETMVTAGLDRLYEIYLRIRGFRE